MFRKRIGLVFLLFLGIGPSRAGLQRAKESPEREIVQHKRFRREVEAFVGQELKASLQEIEAPKQLPDSIFGLPIGRHFTRSTVMVALERYAALSNSRRLGPYHLDRYIRAFGSADAPKGETFAQTYGAQTLNSAYNNPDGQLKTNRLWQTLSPQQRKDWRGYLDVERFYDPEKEGHKQLGGRPTNYWGVAMQIASEAYQTGAWDDRQTLETLAQKCIAILEENNGWMDDSHHGTGRFDRYQFEFVRFVYDAFKQLGEDQWAAKIRPYAKQHAELWWKMLNPRTGHSNEYGRSLQNTWGDTFEQVAFYAQYPELRPAPLRRLATAYHRAFQYWRQQEYDEQAHHNRMLDPGKGTYSYAKIDRVWQYSIGTLGKIAGTMHTLDQALREEGIQSYPGRLPAREQIGFQFFTENQGTRYGLWYVNTPEAYFQVPFLSRWDNSDYRSAPYRYPGLEMPVQERMPLGEPFYYRQDTMYRPTNGYSNLEATNDNRHLSLKRPQWLKQGDERVGLPISVKEEWEYEGPGLRRQVVCQRQAGRGFDSARMVFTFSYPVVRLKAMKQNQDGWMLKFLLQKGEKQTLLTLKSNQPLVPSLRPNRQPGQDPRYLGARQPIASVLALHFELSDWEAGETFRWGYRLEKTTDLKIE